MDPRVAGNKTRRSQALKFMGTEISSLMSIQQPLLSVRRISSHQALTRRRCPFPSNHAAIDLTLQVLMTSMLRRKSKKPPEGRLSAVSVVM